ncbi:MAG: histidine phosphatase family protein [Pseudomonadales bacterium]
MVRIYLVRHGRAAASFTDDHDPGLDEVGRAQAITASQTLAAMTPLSLRTSPLKRAQETAAPLAEILGQTPVIEERFAEIPSPGLTLSDRGPWLRQIMQGSWSQQSQALQTWRARLIECLLTIASDTAIFSHFVAINAAVGAAVNDDQVVLFRPDNGSITTIETDGKTLTLIERGSEAMTHIN